MGWVYAGVATVATAVAVLLAMSYYISERALLNRTRSDDEVVAEELGQARLARGRLEALLASSRMPALRSPYGYKLYARYIPAEAGETNRTVVFAHGVTSTHSGMLKYADLFLRRGFNVLLYDHRRHGKSEGGYTSYGFYEKEDLRAAVDWAFERFGKEAVVGAFGESMGAATVLEYAAGDPRCAFVVVDCPYSDFREQLSYRLREEFRLPRYPLVPLASLWCKLRAGFYLGDASPLRAVPNIRAPIMFVHGLSDDYVRPEMTKALYERASGAKGKRLYLAPNAAHAQSLAADRAAYERELDAFLRMCGY